MDAFLAFRARGRPDAAGQCLEEHAHLRDLLEPMLADGVPDRDTDQLPDRSDRTPATGQCFGDYRIVREVGRGGMGTVFEAEQISLRRRVALKLLHDHMTWSPKAIERFRGEAAAAARLQHPGIVPIHEVGEWQGRHYFTMEFQSGRPLHEVMYQEHFGIRPDCSRTAEAAELIAQVADALQHAHEHGLVHRDVKPHNIMVGIDGTVRLLDFGLAKDVAPVSHSATGEFLGTPHYSSPEQVVGGPVGPASDVFSLGIVLHELLARRRPFDGETARQVLRRIEVGAYEPLAKIAPGTPRDLQTICQKAMAPLPADRYATAGALAADLRRFLRIEPIRARPPGVWVRATKWLRRHRLRVALWSTVSLLVAGAPMAYALHQYRTRVAVEQERQLLDDAEGLAFRSIEQTLAMLAEQLDRLPGPGSKLQTRVDGVVRLCENFLAIRAIDPKRRVRVAHAFYVIGGINMKLGNPDGAMAACGRAMQLLDGGVVAADEQTRQQLRGRLLQRQLSVRQHQDPEGGAAEFEQAMAGWQALAERPDAPTEVVVGYAETLTVRARALAETNGQRLEAERLLRQALAVLGPKRQEASATAELAAIRASNGLGHVLLWTARTAEALAMFEDVQSRIATQPRDPVLGVEQILAVAAIGDAQLELGRSAAGEGSLRGAIDAGRALASEYPGAVHLRRALQRSRVRLGGLLLAQNKAADAEALLREAVVETEAALAAGAGSWIDRALRADIDTQLANCILIRGNGVGNLDEPRQLLLGACSLLEELVRERPEHVEFLMDLGGAWGNLAALANQGVDAAAALQFAERAVACQDRVLAAAPAHRRAQLFLGMHHSQLALALERSGRHADAVAAAIAATRHAPRQAPTLRLVAEVATRCAAAAATNADLSPAQRSDAAADHGRVAVAALEHLADVSVAEASRWLADDRFAFLRERADFAALLTKVGGR